ncbi:MAG: Sigma-70 factor, region 1, partial [Acidimicrobiia bacterium]|nr:Sigma-70 factor, region 1 [Acidimicrobiia bacterium]
MNPTMSALSPWAADAGQRLRELLALGRTRGSLSVSDISSVVDVDNLSAEALATVRTLLEEQGIELVDNEFDLADPALDGPHLAPTEPTEPPALAASVPGEVPGPRPETAAPAAAELAAIGADGEELDGRRARRSLPR